MKRKYKWLALAAIVLLAGCNGDDKPQPIVDNNPAPAQVQQQVAQQPQVVYEQAPQQQPQVVVVQQPQQYDNSGHILSSVATGMMLHHMLSSGSSYRRPTVVNHYHYSVPRSYSSRRSFGRRR